MADRLDNLIERVQSVATNVGHLSDHVLAVEERVLVVEGKVDHLTENVARLSSSVDQRFDALSSSMDQRFDALSASVDQRFGTVDAAFVEQRQYTEFANSRLEAKMDAGFGRVERIERKLDLLIDQRRPRRTRKPRN
jgi:hypothetical protein